ncbi:MAG: hypothetical protein KAV87_33590 [Desulfobacteraceae bacterium]|nr:hypothetical protein [Desulfobacteraceae bacterium]
MVRRKPDFYVHVRFQAPAHNGFKNRSFRLWALTDREKVPNAYTKILSSKGGFSLHAKFYRDKETKMLRGDYPRNRLFAVIPPSASEENTEQFLKTIVKKVYGGFPDKIEFWRAEV